jgi:hypothetical protein
MRLLPFFLAICTAPCMGQLQTKPIQKIVPVEDNSGIIMDIYKQTNAQNAQLSAMASQVADIKDSVSRIETAQAASEKTADEMRHDVDKQGVIANLFVYGVQTFFTIIVAIFVTVPGTFYVQRIMNERSADKPPLTPTA